MDYLAYERRMNGGVRENGSMGRHSSTSPPPMTIGDGKRRPIRDRLQNITTAMAWIKEELVSGREWEVSERERGSEWGVFGVANEPPTMVACV